MPRRVLVTGATSGIGAATVERLVDRGYEVLATARSKDDLARLEKTGLVPIQLELTDPASVEACAARAIEAGPLHGLVNNAGIAVPGALAELSPEGWRRQFEVNLFGPVELTRRLLPSLREERGRVVFVSSQMGLLSIPFWGAYAASKFATEAMADALRMEMVGSGVGVSVIEPAPVGTAFQDRSVALFERYVSSASSEHAAEVARIDQLARMRLLRTRPEAVARAVDRALGSRWPRARYPVGRLTYVGLHLARVLPPRLRDRLVRWVTRP